MEGKNFQFIPTEIIEAWIRGEYYSGEVPSISYQYIGVSLALRGWYTYEVKPQDETIIKGVAKIDFKDGALFVGGMRLYSNRDNENSNLFWMSEFAHFLNENEIIWVYKIFNFKCGSHWLDQYLDKRSRSKAAKYFDQPNFGLNNAQWNRLLDRIRINFYDDLKHIEADCERRGQIDRGLLHFFVKERRAQYGQIYSPSHSGPIIGGEACYSKVWRL